MTSNLQDLMPNVFLRDLVLANTEKVSGSVKFCAKKNHDMQNLGKINELSYFLIAIKGQGNHTRTNKKKSKQVRGSRYVN